MIQRNTPTARHQCQRQELPLVPERRIVPAHIPTTPDACSELLSRKPSYAPAVLALLGILAGAGD